MNSIVLCVISMLRYCTKFDTIFIISINLLARNREIILNYPSCVIVSHFIDPIIGWVYFFIIILPFCCTITRNCIICLLRI